VKSPKELMDIYFTSVGMNGVLLLNLPPNKEGKLSEADIRSLRGFRQLYANTFTDNLLAKAKVTCALSEGKGRNVIDDNYDTSVRPKMGQRVEKFSLEVKDAKGNWKKVTEGTTVGHKRLLKFPVETAKEVRLIISEVRAVPAISEIGLYRLRD